MSARLSATESQGKVARQMGTDLEAARLADNVAPAGIQSAGTGRASDGRYYRGCMSCHSSAGAYADDVAREGWSEFGKASFQVGLLYGSAFLSLSGSATAASEGLSQMDFKELQSVVRANSSEMNAFFKSGGKVVPDHSILQNYRELTTRILNGTGGAPASKLTETSLKVQSQRLEIINKILDAK